MTTSIVDEQDDTARVLAAESYPGRPESPQRLRLAIRGAVQGVGFRPYIYRLAGELGLTGWVNNSAQGVFVEVEGPRAALDAFRERVEPEQPPHACIQSLEASYLDPAGYTAFDIRPSEAGGDRTALILPDLATCQDCLRELFDPTNRRFRYPFTNCTNCGPRYSIIEGLPYDRPNTTMKAFALCAACRAEYDDPLDRRFHAQPTACVNCGPRLEAWDETRSVLAQHDEALALAAAAIRRGQIVAIKGLGGFQLLVDARDGAAVARLRLRKHRDEKPFALMYPSLHAVYDDCTVSAAEKRLLQSSEAPIVLLRRHAEVAGVDAAVAPSNPYFGVMLPYTPLHHLLLADLGFAVVATSGNRSDEPICTDEGEALRRLAGMADLFLVHNRPIARHVDDSVVRVMMGRELVQRRARGFAPLPIQLTNPASALPAQRLDPASALPAKLPGPLPLLAVGAHLKNTVALARGREVFISQHIGDLETTPAYDAFRRVIGDLECMLDITPAAVVHDPHPDYLSTAHARECGSPTIRVQHHLAHVVACMAENDLDGPVLGVAWDGTGYGPDGTIWGGEFFRVDAPGAQRVARLRHFRLPGGDAAIKEPWRTAAGLLYELFGMDALDVMLPIVPPEHGARDLAVLGTMIERGLNAPLTSSMGRLFDGMAALLGLRSTVSFEGQAAMDLEFALDGIDTDEGYTMAHAPDPLDAACLVLDWEPLLHGVLRDLRLGVVVSRIAARFHNTLAESIVAVATRVGEQRVALSGGCFQNAYLTERAVAELRAAGFRPYWHQRIPPNDGGIALGQIAAAIRLKECAYVSGHTG